ncbi:uncharacterized protein LOC105788318 isoform X1 [Gossypium raimondii]|uniref:Uncharacterized protein n=1 Tax=Gossypium raimondii TaxID=29730 RepID=A0A0D2QQH7_GOSRA|nr:uncharacterized protein LOC105788318 isoform X1 [Gossypium raimondii]KJB19201.1 hypothetical protein B456_003G088300 [Gossypium raimondii]
MSITLPMKLLLPLTTPIRIPSSSYYTSFLSSANPNFTFSSSSHHSRTFRRNPHFFSKKKWICVHTRRDQEMDGYRYEEENAVCLVSSDEDTGMQIPTQVQSIVEGSGAVTVSKLKPVPDVDYLQELLAIQQQGPRSIGFFGTRNMGFMHQELIEILSYALVITKNHIFTSGASGTNAAVIRGALRAEKPELLTVILPQSLKKQPPESQELLEKVQTVIEKPYNDHLPLIEASRLCNRDIISHVQQVICFAFHDSKLLMETCQEAKNLRKIVTLFYLD